MTETPWAIDEWKRVHALECEARNKAETERDDWKRRAKFYEESVLKGGDTPAIENLIAAIDECVPKMATVEKLTAIVGDLWQIIDDIDTYGDMAKADDKLFRSLVERRQKDRWKTGITTDGYKLSILGKDITPKTKPQEATDSSTPHKED